MDLASAFAAALLALTPAPAIGDAGQDQACSLAFFDADAYLWERYAATPKVDSHGSFEGKDERAAEKIGMSVRDYVIGGMRPDFRRKLAVLLRAAEAGGLNPGITSGFRDDYRQSIASGRKSRVGRSFHGGSEQGGYGHGRAADVVAIAPTRRGQMEGNPALWRWIDDNKALFGLGRPYGDRDAPHIAPLGGGEYASYELRKRGKTAKKRHIRHAHAKRKTKLIRLARR